MEYKTALAMVGRRRKQTSPCGWQIKTTLNIFGGFFDIRDAEFYIDLDDEEDVLGYLEIRLNKQYEELGTKRLFNRIVIERVKWLSYSNLPKATVYLNEEIIRIYSPHDFYTDYLAFEFNCSEMIDAFVRLKEKEHQDLIIATDGSVFKDTKLYNCAERDVNDITQLSGIWRL